VFTLAAKVTGGSLRTIEFASKHGKPCVHIPLGDEDLFFDPGARLKKFVGENGIKRLNVAGSRESKEPGLHDAVVRVLEDALIIAGAT